MKTAFFSTRQYDRTFFESANTSKDQDLSFFDVRLDSATAALANGFQCVCIFVNDRADRNALEILKKGGTSIIALRCAGFNNVDLKAARELGITVVRVPSYSPHSIAEHTFALILALNRKIHKAYNRVREGNFRLNGLLGFDLFQKTIGIVGTGNIGIATAGIAKGFGMNILAYDVRENPECLKLGAKYCDIDSLFRQSDIISLHCPLNQHTLHLINEKNIEHMKPGVMIINTSRGAVIDTSAVIKGLKSRRIGYLGMDVYEQEGDLFFEDLSDQVIQDDDFERLLSFPNVLITGHQGFFTENAMRGIAEITLENIRKIEKGEDCPNCISTEKIVQ